MSTKVAASNSTRSRFRLAALGPGLLIAATGVGAGDLATASLAGMRLGTAILWAVVLGALLKYVLNEGLARYQLATGQTLLEGAMRRLGRPVIWIFLPYLLIWSVAVGAALVSACGVALHAIAPFSDDPARGKVVYGVLCSVVAVGLVRKGGFKLFEKVMSVCIVVMFITVIITAIAIGPDLGAVLRGLFIPTIPATPDKPGAGVYWTVGLMGGVGGTLTVLCYGYWIREIGRDKPDDLKTTRIDLGVGYIATAIFGVAMVIIGSRVNLADTGGGSAGLIVKLSQQLGDVVGPAGKWIFLIGAFGALFSSLLGVWQSVPYIFADFWRLKEERAQAQAQAAIANDEALVNAAAWNDDDDADPDNPDNPASTDSTDNPPNTNESDDSDHAAHKIDSGDIRETEPAAALNPPAPSPKAMSESRPYLAYLAAIAIVPLIIVPSQKFSSIQLVYAVVGAFFMPLLATTLLLLNGRSAWVGKRFRNGPLTIAALSFTLIFFAWFGLNTIRTKWPDLVNALRPAPAAPATDPAAEDAQAPTSPDANEPTNPAEPSDSTDSLDAPPTPPTPPPTQ